VPQSLEFVGTVHDLASSDCRIQRLSPTTKPEFPKKKAECYASA
jgi:hypothetical protein